jgi:hypothetical protein
MDEIEYATRQYTDETTGKPTYELSILMSTGGGHIVGAVPVVDVVKYALLHCPELVDRAQSELSEYREQQAAERKAKEAKEAAAEAFCLAFVTEFPSKKESERLACDASHTWMRVIDGQPTSGEGCIIEGLSLVDYYDGREPLYLFGVLKRVCDWAESVGWRAELANPGTVKFYQE